MTKDEQKSKLKDFDSAESAFRLHSFGWSGYAGILGMFAGFGLAMRLGIRGPLMLLLVIGGLLVFWALIHFGAMYFADRAGAAGASIYMSSGSSTPAKREYSRADALNMHGKYAEAELEYQHYIGLYPDDPEPRLRLARMLRDRLQRYEDAALWFRQVLNLPELDSGVWVQTARELAELYTHRIRQPERALPVLAQLHHRHPTTPGGQWAKQEMRTIKQAMRDSLG